MQDFSRPVDVIGECSYKIAFLSDFFTQPLAKNENTFLSEPSCQGLALILFEIREALDKATDQITVLYKRKEA